MTNITLNVVRYPQNMINREDNPHNAAAMIAANRAIASIDLDETGLEAIARRYYERQVQTYRVYEFIRHTTITNYEELTNGLNSNGYRYFARAVANALAELVDSVHRICVAEQIDDIAILEANNARLDAELQIAEADRAAQTARVNELEEALMGLLTAQGVVEGTEDYQRALQTLGL